VRLRVDQPVGGKLAGQRVGQPRGVRDRREQVVLQTKNPKHGHPPRYTLADVVNICVMLNLALALAIEIAHALYGTSTSGCGAVRAPELCGLPTLVRPQPAAEHL
jgi:hypothetical protein